MLKGKIIFYWNNENSEIQPYTAERGVGQKICGLAHEGKRPNKCQLTIEIENDNNLTLESAKFIKWLQCGIFPGLEYKN